MVSVGRLGRQEHCTAALFEVHLYILHGDFCVFVGCFVLWLLLFGWVFTQRLYSIIQWAAELI